MAREEVLEVHTVAGAESIGALNTLVQQLTAQPLGLATRTTIVMETHSEKVGGIDLGSSSK
jgi:hypothetical protein